MVFLIYAFLGGFLGAVLSAVIATWVILRSTVKPTMPWQETESSETIPALSTKETASSGWASSKTPLPRKSKRNADENALENDFKRLKERSSREQ